MRPGLEVERGEGGIDAQVVDGRGRQLQFSATILARCAGIGEPRRARAVGRIANFCAHRAGAARQATEHWTRIWICREIALRARRDHYTRVVVILEHRQVESQFALQQVHLHADFIGGELLCGHLLLLLPRREGTRLRAVGAEARSRRA